MDQKAYKNSLPRSVKDLSKEQLTEIVQKKKLCNKRALHVVEVLSEQLVDCEWMLNNLFFINQCHYDDIVIERSIAKYCGYPICHQALNCVPKQQYKISLNKKCVYDISERKNYCSNKCFKASEFLKKQLLTSPLWFRDTEVTLKFKLLQEEVTCSSAPDYYTGNTIIDCPGDIRRETPQNCQSHSTADWPPEAINQCIGDIAISPTESTIAKDQIALSGFQDTVFKTSGCLKKQNDSIINETIEDLAVSGNKQAANDQTSITGVECHKPLTANTTLSPENIRNITKLQNQTSSRKRNSSESPCLASNPKKISNEVAAVCDSVTTVETSLEEWFTLETYVYLMGEGKLKEAFSGKEDALVLMRSSLPKSEAIGRKFEELSRLFSILHLDGEVESKPKLKPLPDYSSLKAEAENSNLKVRAFYTGQLEVALTRLEISEQVEEPRFPSVLPLVDSHAQNALRRRVLLDRLSRVVGDLCVSVGVPPLDSRELRELVHTFTLYSHNVTFNPTQCYLIAAIFIKLFSLRNKALAANLCHTDTKNRVTLFLLSYNLPPDYLDNLMEWITDTERLTRALMT